MRVFKRRHKIAANVLVLSILFQTTVPYVGMALTGGPSSPEYSSFSAVEGEYVDMTSGDFNYSIPLMEVPGPNGSFPLSLSYSSDVTMEQEASWVGLGWNLNTGTINRGMQGVPDDFNGSNDKVTTQTYSKPQTNIAFLFDKNNVTKPDANSFEMYGIDIAPNWTQSVTYNKYGLSWDNYAGFGISYSRSKVDYNSKYLGNGIYEGSKSESTPLSFNSASGYDLQLPSSISKKIERVKEKLGRFGSLSTQGGLQMSFNFFGTYFPVPLGTGSSLTSIGGGQDYTNYNFGGRFSLGQSNILGHFEESIGFDAQVNVTNLKSTNQVSKPAYGYLNSENAIDNSIMDYRIHNDVPINRNSKIMGQPIETIDHFNVSGPGIGGAFRAYRNDVGIYHPDRTETDSYTGDLGIELSTGPNAVHVGGDGGLGYGYSTSGDWQSGKSNLNYLDFDNFAGADIQSEKFYFAFTNETVEDVNDRFTKYKENNPLAFDIKRTFVSSGSLFDIRAHDYFTDNDPSDKISSSNANQLKREKRVNEVYYETKARVLADEEYDSRGEYLWTEGTNPITNPNNGGQYVYGKSFIQDNHIVKYRIKNSGGMSYNYDIPVYNTMQKEVSFALDPSVALYTANPDNIAYTGGSDNDINNGNGLDEYYQSTSISPYAYAYLLTSITSSDYIDLKGDGPSEDDFGFWAKLNYSEHTSTDNYKWRTPYEDASFNKGSYSTNWDDKGSYSYGEKELYYVNSIETKTHIAVFYTSTRQDALGAKDENNSSGTEQTMMKLDKIELYSKKDLSTPVKTAHFSYDYLLCGGTPNSNATGGKKLTLTEVYFTYQGTVKGEDFKYTFNYGNLEDGSQNEENPAYSLNNMDRWGTYQQNNGSWSTSNSPSVRWNNNENPYTRHYDYINDNTINASAWKVTQINLPSGGTIEVDYEHDDYAYVQDREAMQMFRLVEFLDEIPPSYSSGPASESTLSRSNNIAVVDLGRPGVSNGEFQEMLSNLDNIAFKAFVRVRNQPLNAPVDAGQDAYEYVRGYFQPDLTEIPKVIGNYGFFAVQPADYMGINQQTGLGMHPVRKAAMQYMKSLGHLDNFPQISSGLTAIGTLGQFVSSFVTNTLNMFGYYSRGLALGYGNTFVGNVLPSFVRLKTIDKVKIGGGSRVAKITMKNTWTGERQRDFVYEYFYRTESGISSGVADYEPGVGGEENPFHEPLWYNGNSVFNVVSDMNYSEGPILEPYFPSPKVVYSRVVKRQVYDANYADNQSGISVSEFYTSKDFPAKVTKTGVKSPWGMDLVIPIPTIGQIQHNTHGYSQGFCIELSNMSGVIKSTKTYKAIENLEDLTNYSPIAKTIYKYHTDPNDGKKLSGEVEAIKGHRYAKDVTMGKKMDFFVSTRESNNFNIYEGLNANLEVLLPAAIPNAYPQYQLSRSITKQIATTKVIYQTPILKEVKTYTDGAWTFARNHLYDSETGDAILTSVQNEWEKPIYTYNYAGHWNYSAFRGSYSNVNISGTANVNASGNITSVNPSSSLEDVFHLGDEVKIYLSTSGEWRSYWVTSVSDQYPNVELSDESGNKPTNGSPSFYIYKSGRKNMQSVGNGSIVTLGSAYTDNLSNTYTGLPMIFEIMNDIAAGNQSYTINNSDEIETTIPSSSCLGGYDSLVVRRTTYLDHTPRVLMQYILKSGETECVAYSIMFYSNTNNYYYDEYISSMTEFVDETVYSDYISNPTSSPNNDITLSNEGNSNEYQEELVDGSCVESCVNPISVLHADAVTYSDDWNYFLKDEGDPEIRGAISLADNLSTVNPYAYGIKGIWRTDMSFAYQDERIQSGTTSDFKTKINKDGEYVNFYEFDWEDLSNNDKWDWVETITNYSPYGNAVEAVNRIDVFSSNMYGYENSLVTASGMNGMYFELAYDGFEEFDTYQANGHLDFTNAVISGTTSHTGEHSINVSGTCAMTGTSVSAWDGTNYPYSVTEDQFQPVESKKYVVSAWFYTGGGASGEIQIDVNSTGYTNYSTTNSDFEEIDGWTKVEGILDLSGYSSGTNYTINLYSAAGCNVDDVRISPFNGGIKTYAYDKSLFKIVAEHDALNYSLIYNYDEEGKLIQQKKETDKGVVTISSGRMNNAYQ